MRAIAASALPPTATRTLTTALALAGSTLAACEPSSIVTTAVVRQIAPSSPPAPEKIFSSSGLNSHRLAMTRRRPKDAWGASRLNIAIVAAGNLAGKGWSPRRFIARARRQAASRFGGVAEWPPGLFTRSSMLVTPFSATPTMASGFATPGNTPRTTAPPSSSTSPGFTPIAAI